MTPEIYSVDGRKDVNGPQQSLLEFVMGTWGLVVLFPLSLYV